MARTTSYWQDNQALELARDTANLAAVPPPPFSYSTSGQTWRQTTSARTQSVIYTPDDQLIFSARGGNEFGVCAILRFSGATGTGATGEGLWVGISGSNTDSNFSGHISISTLYSGQPQGIGTTPYTYTSNSVYHTIRIDGVYYNGTLPDGTSVGTAGVWWNQSGLTSIKLTSGSYLGYWRNG